MSAPRPALQQQAEALRQAFDSSFAQPLAEAGAAPDDYLAIRVADDPHVLRLAEIASLLPLRTVTRLPSPLPALLGIVGFRGSIVPLYDLRSLLGYPAGPDGDNTPRWMVITAALPLGLAFDAFEGHWRQPRTASAPPVAGPARAHVRELLAGTDAGAGAPRPVLSVASLLAAIQDLARAHPGQQEER
ncbi:chemotaxis protein CheW [Aquabacterium sp.]|uniref:chemotaxis protein CheW n=1 Tax=Aquabacterium sp. TaxID=1872578 RepID=UPI002BD4696A|nr:chemotaxis protein CheW [Aquabacterium sp.]HSW08805.1 chemotaxis protein CheW [Aquabacterium sp.]